MQCLYETLTATPLTPCPRSFLHGESAGADMGDVLGGEAAQNIAFKSPPRPLSGGRVWGGGQRNKMQNQA